MNWIGFFLVLWILARFYIALYRFIDTCVIAYKLQEDPFATVKEFFSHRLTAEDWLQEGFVGMGCFITTSFIYVCVTWLP